MIDLPENINMPADKQALLARVVGLLTEIQGVRAVVLGGSYARGAQHAGSDLDIGIYYFEDAPFEIEQIRQAARALSVEGEPTVTGFYEWGAWVNGGAWIHTANGKVDFLYRNLTHVERTIQEALAGKVALDYNQQPPFGFSSIIYLAETRVCLPLFDPEGRIARLKQLVQAYPPALKEKIPQDGLWSGEFTLLHAQSYASRGDVLNTVGCLARVANHLTHVLYALNERFFINDKTTLAEIATFSTVPPDYASRLNALLACPGLGAAQLSATVEGMWALWKDVVVLTEGKYKPQFRL